MFVVFPNICNHTHTDTDTHTQYDYHTLPPMLCGKSNNYTDDNHQLRVKPKQEDFEICGDL